MELDLASKNLLFLSPHSPPDAMWNDFPPSLLALAPTLLALAPTLLIQQHSRSALCSGTVCFVSVSKK